MLKLVLVDKADWDDEELAKRAEASRRARPPKEFRDEYAKLMLQKQNTRNPPLEYSNFWGL